MLHNQPFKPSTPLASERPFADILKSTYALLDKETSKLREAIADTVKRFIDDPTEVISWRGQGVVENQTTLSILIEISTVLAKAVDLEDVPASFEKFCQHYKDRVVAWARYGENSTSSMSNITSRMTLVATARVFGSWELASEIERAIRNDIEESKKRVVVVEFAALKVDEWFRALPDQSSMAYRKLSPRKAIEGVWPANKAQKRTFRPRDRVYVFRVPLETDVLYVEEAA